MFTTKKGARIRSFNYENFLLSGDFNAEMTPKFERILQFIFAEKFNKKSRQPKCCCSSSNNRPRSFCNSDILEIGLLDCHKLTLTVLKTYFQKWLTIEITRIFQMNSFVQI